MPVILRAEDFYTPPSHLPADAWGHLAGAERVIAWYEQTAQRRLPRPVGEPSGEPLYARIDAGRWVAQCPCGSAQVVTPSDPRMFCVECLTGWRPVLIPADIDAAERSVVEAPVHARFWWHPDDPARGTTEV